MRFFAALLISATLLTTSNSMANTGDTADAPRKRSSQSLEDQVLNQNLTLEKRVKALKTLLADEMKDGHLKRTFCVWDPIGKAGPIAAATNDQILRSLHYGMKLTIEVYQDESLLIEDFKAGEKCDAALIRGSMAMSFNPFLATLEAPGALPSREHLHLLAQVLAKPSIGDKLTNGQYTALGVVTMGGHHIFTSSPSLATLRSLENSMVYAEESDPGYARLLEKLGARPRTSGLAATVLSFTTGVSPIIAGADVGYLIMGNGQAPSDSVGIRSTLGQSTLQLVGHADRFPAGLAQILREDFLFRFNNYARLVDKELGNLPENFWLPLSDKDNLKLAKAAQNVRIALRDEGYYDSSMLRLARKIRCRFEPDASECKTPLE